MDNIKKILKLLSKKQKVNLAVLIVMTAFGTALELLGISAIMPFVELITNPQELNGDGFVAEIYRMLGSIPYNMFLIFLLLVLIAIYLFKNAYLIILYNFQYKFTYDNQRKLEDELLESYLYQDYSFHLKHNSAELQRNILQDVMGVVHTVLSYLQLLTEGSVCVIIFIYLLYLDKSITLGVVIILGLVFLGFNVFFKEKVKVIGEESRKSSALRVQWVQQSLGGIKEVKILGREKFFYDHYDENAAIYAEKQRKYQLSTTAPRPLMEAAGISALLFIIGIKLYIGVSATYFLPTLSTFAVAAFRILPSFGRVSGCIGAISFQKSAVNEVYEGIQHAKELQKSNSNQLEQEKDFIFENSIEINQMTFSYPETDKVILKNVDLKIEKNQSVAFIGPSGAGKTTLVDIILGILKPLTGGVYVDDRNIEENLQGWHQKIGYIPQSIYLMDDTVRKNIALGINDEDIDEDRIWEVLREVQLYDFVRNMEQGVDTFIGEGGVRLSGGQRQRIGIARALYHNPEVLVLDEATSALDSETETAIMEAINHLHGSKTILIIAHRLTTIRNCDVIYQVKDMKVIETTLDKEE